MILLVKDILVKDMFVGYVAHDKHFHHYIKAVECSNCIYSRKYGNKG